MIELTSYEPAGRAAADAGVSPVDDHRSGGEMIQVRRVAHAVVVGGLQEAGVVSWNRRDQNKIMWCGIRSALLALRRGNTIHLPD